MLLDLARRLGAGLIAAIMIAVAAGIVLVAAAFAAYAALKTVVSPAAASALTAAAFAVVAGLIAVLAPRMITRKSATAPVRTARLDPDTLRTATEISAAVLGVVGNMVLNRRAKRAEQARDQKRSRR